MGDVIYAWKSFPNFSIRCVRSPNLHAPSHRCLLFVSLFKAALRGVGRETAEVFVTFMIWQVFDLIRTRHTHALSVRMNECVSV